MFLYSEQYKCFYDPNRIITRYGIPLRVHRCITNLNRNSNKYLLLYGDKSLIVNKEKLRRILHALIPSRIKYSYTNIKKISREFISDKIFTFRNLENKEVYLYELFIEFKIHRDEKVKKYMIIHKNLLYNKNNHIQFKKSTTINYDEGIKLIVDNLEKIDSQILWKVD